jgi:hypothetical protein
VRSVWTRDLRQLSPVIVSSFRRGTTGSVALLILLTRSRAALGS